MHAVSYRRLGVRYGFEREDVSQEFELGKIMSERTRPGNKLSAWCRGKVRAGRHRKKEREWAQIRLPITEYAKTIDPNQYELALAHEIMDLLPYAEKEGVLKALLEGDGREMRRVGRMIREKFPRLVKD